MQTTFTAATQPITVDIKPGVAKTFTLPIIDPTNPDMYVVNRASAAVFLAFGPNAAVGPGVPGCAVIGAMQHLTLTTKTEVLAVAERHLVQGGEQAERARFTMVAIVWATRAGSLVIYRGQVSLVEGSEEQDRSIFDQNGRARAECVQEPVPATIWRANKPGPQTSTHTAWPEGWAPNKGS